MNPPSAPAPALFLMTVKHDCHSRVPLFFVSGRLGTGGNTPNRVYGVMIRLTGWVWLAVAASAGQGLGIAQVLNNQYLTGKYFFRQVSIGTDGTGGITD